MIGGVIGLLLAMFGVHALGAAFRGGVFQVDVYSWLTGAGLMVLLAIGVGLPPAWRAMRLKIVDALAAH